MNLRILYTDGYTQNIVVKRAFSKENEELGKSWLYYEIPGTEPGKGTSIDMQNISEWEIQEVPHNCMEELNIPFCKRCENCKELQSELFLPQYFCTLSGKNLPVDPNGFCYKGKKGEPKVEVEKPTRKHVDIYTDGACKGNPGPGGWGSIVVFNGVEKEISGGDIYTTNNRMELMAVISALSLLKDACDVTLTTDSKYIVDAIQKGWLKSWKKKNWKKADGSPVLNPNLWKKLDELLEKHDVHFVWVKGHAGHPYNERCDKLAVKAIGRKGV